jgi:hypothetical protein
MCRIDAHFQRLQPVAFNQTLECKSVGIGRNKAVDFRKRRRLAFAEIGPQDAALLHDGISALLDVLAEHRADRLSRRLKAISLHIEQPAVKRTAQTTILKPAERKVRAAMRAIAVHQAITALLVTEQDEVFTKQSHRANRTRAFEFIDQRRGLPIHPHQLAARIGAPGAGDQIVLLLAHHGCVVLPVPRGLLPNADGKPPNASVRRHVSAIETFPPHRARPRRGNPPPM